MKNQELIGLVSNLSPLWVNGYNSNHIDVHIARTETNADGVTTPRNWSLDYTESKTSTGGCFCRIFASKYENEPTKVLFGWYGPEITHGEINQYKHAVRAMERINKALDKFTETRGSTNDAGDCIGRFLEAAGITKVYVRPDGQANQGWHNKGDWDILTIGQTLVRIRHCFPKSSSEAIAA